MANTVRCLNYPTKIKVDEHHRFYGSAEIDRTWVNWYRNEKMEAYKEGRSPHSHLLSQFYRIICP